MQSQHVSNGLDRDERRSAARILTINTGSSSLKAALYAIGTGDPARQRSFQVERIGSDQARSSIRSSGEDPEIQTGRFPDHASALGWVLADLNHRNLISGIAAVGHRIVHGGPRYSAPERVSPEMIAAFRKLFAIDPEHLPQAAAAMRTIANRFPDLPQIACFDTHFHDAMPAVAKLLPLPRWLMDEGVRRYGFHGLSYESIMAQLARVDPATARGRIVIAHLGAGASMVAVRDGRSVDTTMGFTPSGGLMMGTRPGDLDPGLLLYLLQVRAMSADAINRLLNKESGLLGVSGASQDLRDLLAAEASDQRAQEAVALFCHIAKKHLAGLSAVLGGIDTLIFTGGIGEHAAPVRSRVCDGLDFIGIEIDPDRNAARESIISPDGAATTVRVMQTDEELTVARHTVRLIASEGSTHVAF